MKKARPESAATKRHLQARHPQTEIENVQKYAVKQTHDGTLGFGRFCGDSSKSLQVFFECNPTDQPVELNSSISPEHPVAPI